MKKKLEPYIDYEKAKLLVRMYDFILHANYEREKICKELDRLILWAEVTKDNLAPIDPSKYMDYFEHNTSYCYFRNDIAKLRNDAWEAGLTHTLFEKLKNDSFRYRFTGHFQPPVIEEEIKDHYSDDDEEEA